MRDMLKPAAAFGLAAAMALSVATPAAAAPVLTNTTAVKAAMADDATQVRWRGRGWRGHGGHGWVPGAVVGGLAAGAIIGSQAYRADPYYGGYAYQAYPGYAPGYAPGYVYQADPYAYSYSSGPYYRRGWGARDRDCLGDYDSGGARC